MTPCLNYKALLHKHVSFVILLFSASTAAAPSVLASFGPVAQGGNNEKLVVMCEESIKSKLDNPRSYELVEGFVGQFNLVVVTYRATNSVGELVTQRVACNGTRVVLGPSAP